VTKSIRLLVACAFLLCVGAVPAQAVQAVVNGQEVTCAGNDVVCSLPSPTTTGNLVIVGAWVAADQTITINNATCTFTATSNSPFTSTVDGTVRMYIWSCPADGDSTFTFTTSGTGAAGVKMVEVTETTSTGHVVGSGDSASSSAPAAAVTTVAANSFIFSIARSGANRTWTPGSGYTLIDTVGSTTLAASYKVDTSAGVDAVDYTISSATSWAVLSAAFPSSAPAVSAVCTRALLGVGC
jgi:hypothetical protein